MEESPPERPSSAQQNEATQSTATTPSTNPRPTFLQELDLLGVRNPIFETLGRIFRKEWEGTNLNVRVLDIGENGEVRLHDDYDIKSPGTWSHVIKTRLVVISYDHAREIDYSILANICFVYRLNPYHIWRIVKDESVWLDLNMEMEFMGPATDEYCGLKRDVLAEKTFFEIGFGRYKDDKLSAVTVKALHAEDFDTVIIWLLAEQLTAALEKLQDFTSANEITHTPSVRLLETTLQMLVEKTKRLKEALKDQLSRRAAIMSLRESRKSIQLADSVRNLTQLAFVFIPLTFGASIFGSNLQEFGSGSVPAWKFCVSLIAVLVGTFCVTWLWSIRAAKIIPAYKKKEKYTLFFLRAPALGILLCLYMWARGKHAKNPHVIVHDLGVSSLTYGPRAISSTLFEPAPSTKNFHERVWINCLYWIGQYTSQDKWWEDRFYKPWIRARRLPKLKEQSSKQDNGV